MVSFPPLYHMSRDSYDSIPSFTAVYELLCTLANTQVSMKNFILEIFSNISDDMKFGFEILFYNESNPKEIPQAEEISWLLKIMSTCLIRTRSTSKHLSINKATQRFKLWAEQIGTMMDDLLLRPRVQHVVPQGGNLTLRYRLHDVTHDYGTWLFPMVGYTISQFF